MTGKIKYFNTEDAAKILGVNVSTIKRWTENGSLSCIKTAGGHRKFLLSHLSAFVEFNRKKNSKVNLFTVENEEDIEISYHILKGDFLFLNRYILEQSLNSNRDKIQQVLNGLYLGQYHLHTIYDLVVTPVLHQIGFMWSENKISIVEEHLASHAIRDCITRLQGIIKISEHRNEKAFCMTPSKELHDIPLKMIDHILEVRGFSVLYSGQLTPLEMIEEAFRTYTPHRLYLSSTTVQDREELQKEVSRLFDIARDHTCDIYVGGKAFDVIDTNHPSVIRRLYTFEEVHLY